MNKTALALALLLASPAGAQTWDVDELGKLSLVGCYGKQDGVYCDLSFTLTKKQTADVRWYAGNFKVFKADGTSQNADKVAFIDGKFNNYSSNGHEVIANVPLKVQLYFNVPSSVSGFRAIAFKDQKFDNIAVRAFGQAPSTPAALPAGSAVKGFAIALSNCQLQGQNYVCTATLTPTK